MKTKDEALKMAIDDARIGLGKVRQHLGWQEPKEDELCLEILKAWKTLDACKEALSSLESDALAETEKQEPVVWLSTESKANEIIKTNPATWQSLSDDEIVGILGNIREKLNGGVFLAFARAIEQALKEKNT
jgi:hypothetical protein